MDPLVDYYSRRAREYESIYRREDPIRQSEQQAILEALRRLFRGRRVLEVACGTGYWTCSLAEVVDHLCATDASSETLALARAKPFPPAKVDFHVADAYVLGTVPGTFTGGFANFWL